MLGHMAEDIADIVSGLPRLTSVTGVWQLAEDRLVAGDAAYLGDLCIALTERYSAGGAKVWQYGAVVDRLVRLLCLTPGRGHVEQVLRVCAAAGDPRRTRYVASLLAAGQPAHDLAFVFADPAADLELRACLAQEVVLRRVALDTVVGPADLAATPGWRGHPLQRLPTSLTVLEGEPPLPAYGVAGGSSLMPYGPAARPRSVPDADATRIPAATDATTDSSVSAITAAVANWAEESNGTIEARVFTLAGAVTGETVAGTLVTLPLRCLRGVGRRTGLSVARSDPTTVWQTLFAAAADGGAYNSGAHGAYGRLAAWRSVAGLVGAPDDAPVAELERRAMDHSWYEFDADTDWYCRIAWDLGLVVVAPDGRRLTVLAATDTD
jgi:hypothetical protein